MVLTRNVILAAGLVTSLVYVFLFSSLLRTFPGFKGRVFFRNGHGNQSGLFHKAVDFFKPVKNTPPKWNRDFYQTLQFNRTGKYARCFKNVKFVESSPPWQILESRSSRKYFYLFGAYWDNRFALDGSIQYFNIRVLAKKIINRPLRLSGEPIGCVIWYEGQDRLLFKITTAVLMHFEQKETNQPDSYLLSCATKDAIFNDDVIIPVGVSLLTKDDPRFSAITSDTENYSCSEMSNFLPLIYNPLPPGQKVKQDFAICHKALYYDRKANQPAKFLMEWAEIHRILGVKQIFMYSYFPTQNSNFSKILKYYEKQGFLQLEPWTIPETAGKPPEQIKEFLREKRRQQVFYEELQFQDCFFRNMYRFKYIAVLDMDEVIMPVIHKSWGDLIQALKEIEKEDVFNPISAFHFDNYVFPDSFPNLTERSSGNIRMLKQTVMLQSENYLKRGKGILSTDVVVALKHDDPLACLGRNGPACQVVDVDETGGRLHHYCIDGYKNCSNYINTGVIQDDAVFKFQKELKDAVHTVQEKLGLQ